MMFSDHCHYHPQNTSGLRSRTFLLSLRSPRCARTSRQSQDRCGSKRNLHRENHGEETEDPRAEPSLSPIQKPITDKQPPQQPFTHVPPGSQLPTELSTLAVSIRDRVRILFEHHGVFACRTQGQGGWQHHNNIRDGVESITIALPVVISVSGGCDSVALFHALLEWNRSLQGMQNAPRYDPLATGQNHGYNLDLSITVVHFHHRQRPESADSDCELVRGMVATATSDGMQRLAFRLEDWKNVTIESDDSFSSFSQDRARVWRRTKLEECASEQLRLLHERARSSSSGKRDFFAAPFGVVLTAHHDDDSYETVLIKLLRGVHLLNLHDKATIASIAPMPSSSVGFCSQKNSDRTDGHSEIESSIYLVRPFVTDTTPYNHQQGIPLPGHTKDDLLRYLTERNLPWREDESNKDPKYLRNRVRNELIPLLAELSEDSFRTKRLPALLEQSRNLSGEVTPRVEKYLQNALVKPETGTAGVDRGESSTSLFSIKEYSDDGNDGSKSSSRWIRSQALYEWMSRSIAEQLKKRQLTKDEGATIVSNQPNRHVLSYESLQRVLKQLEMYPDRNQWTLELGAGWIVQRMGDVLMVQEADAGEDPYDASFDENHHRIDWEWSFATSSNNENDAQQDSDKNKRLPGEEEDDSEQMLLIGVSREFLQTTESDLEGLSFFSTTLRIASATMDGADTVVPNDSSNSGKRKARALRFSPPWRNSPLKLRAFLRGQKVPMRLRDETRLLFAELPSDPPNPPRLVAVRVKDKWIVSKEFLAESNPDKKCEALSPPFSAIIGAEDEPPSCAENMEIATIALAVYPKNT
ncbi:unnamed protein product [Pseudo-nitzschia multistriata]|uniref:tRNA(Ile)-lysidine synthetase n=1 Tax=Pseudo-nitzschia multistriata TaxID=183589 RepID=A0A448Z2T4_9STRA|nr:unnamed protein product [Pseudo-nitzschia multistriata]